MRGGWDRYRSDRVCGSQSDYFVEMAEAMPRRRSSRLFGFQMFFLMLEQGRSRSEILRVSPKGEGRLSQR